MCFMLDKDSKIPMHHQVYCYLKQSIEQGKYKPGDTIPSENEMQNMLGVSRITVRRAIQDLVHDGYLKKSRGKGTTVIQTKDKYNLTELTSFSSDLSNRGEKSGSIILKLKKIPASVKVSEALKVNMGEEVYLLKRLRLMDGKVIGLHDAYITTRKNIVLDQDDFTINTSLYALLEEMGIILDSADETIEAKMPSIDLKRQLNIDDYQPVFYKERITYDNENIPIEYVEISYIADRYKYFVHMSKAK